MSGLPIDSSALLADLLAFIEASPCACTPLFDDQPDGSMFGPPCERCKLIERAADMKANAKRSDGSEPFAAAPGSAAARK